MKATISSMGTMAVAAVCLMSLAACQSQRPAANTSQQGTSVAEAYQTRQQVAAAGGIPFKIPSRVLETLTDWSIVNESVVTYYSVGGEKIFQRLGSGEVVARTWRVRSDGVICETLVGSGEELCGPDASRALLLNDILYVFNPAGDVTGEFRVVQGDMRR